MTGRRPDLCLLAVTTSGSPAALTVCQIEEYDADPGHNRRGGQLRRHAARTPAARAGDVAGG